MNIFFLNRDPKKAAVVQYNKHVVKMILESAQMLCTAHHVFNNGHNVPYKKAHLNHPSTIWVRQADANYYWLYDHMLALGEEYTKRYGKIHLTITKCKEALKFAPDGIPLSYAIHSEPPQCMPDEYKVEGDSVTAYWNYYENEKHSVRGLSEQIITRSNG